MKASVENRMKKQLTIYRKYSGTDREVHLPEQVDGLFVNEIGPKAFLSCKAVERLYLPDGIEKIGDWAFAHMKNLKEMHLPARNLVWGKQVLMGCEQLSQVHMRGVRLETGMEFFIATMLRYFESEQLLQFQELQTLKGQQKWLEQYDRHLLEYLKQTDEKGFVPAFIGWFDVEDVEPQKVRYIQQMKQEKLEIILQRCRFPNGLSVETEEKLRGYVGQHQPEMLQLFANSEKSYGQSICYYKIWQERFGISGQQAKRLLEGETEQDAEIRAYLMKIVLEEGEKQDFFGSLMDTW